MNNNNDSASKTQENLAKWQPEYARHGVNLFPVVITGKQKKPAVRNYMRTTPASSRAFAEKFPDAQAFGFACGKPSGLTILDIDTPDAKVVTEAEKLFGSSPILWRTGSGHYAMPFRHNGEEKRIKKRVRPIDGLEIDILASGFAVAPPSLGAVASYEILRGNLDDIVRLPVMRLPVIAIKDSAEPPEIAADDFCRRTEGKILVGKRNETLFYHCMSQAHFCDTLDDLLDCARTFNGYQCDVPLEDSEVTGVAKSAWQYTKNGKNFIGKGQMVLTSFDEVDDLAASCPDAFALLSILRRHHNGRDEFILAKGMAPSLKWTLPRFKRARDELVRAGHIQCIYQGGRGKNDPPIYSWAEPERDN